MPTERDPVSDTRKVIRSLGFNPNHVSSAGLEAVTPHVDAILGILAHETHSHETHEGKIHTDALAVSVWKTFQELPSNLTIHDLIEWDSWPGASGIEKWHDFMSGLKRHEKRAINQVLGIFRFTSNGYDPIATLTDLDIAATDENGYKEYKRIGDLGIRFFRIAFQGATPEELSGNIPPKE